LVDRVNVKQLKFFIFPKSIIFQLTNNILRMNNQSKPELIFPSFDGDPLKYLIFIRAVLEYLEACSPYCVQGMGLRGFFDTEADFLLPIRPGVPPLAAVPFV